MPCARMRLSVASPQQRDWALRHAEEVTELFVDARLVRARHRARVDARSVCGRKAWALAFKPRLGYAD